MGLGSFLKNVGEKIFGGGETPEEQAQKVKNHVAKYGFDTSGITFTVKDDKVTISGEAKDWEQKGKIYVAAGNVEGIDGVTDNIIRYKVVSRYLKFRRKSMVMLTRTTKSSKPTNQCFQIRIKFIQVKFWLFLNNHLRIFFKINPVLLESDSLCL